MNKAYDYVLNKMKEMQYSENPEDIAEFLWEFEIVKDKDLGDSRWWTNLFRIIDLDGKLVGFQWAHSTGDMNMFERGWTFSPDTICFIKAEKKIITITEYRKVEE